MSQNRTVSSSEWLLRKGKLGGRTAEFPWEDTTLGRLESWPEHLRFAVNLMLGAGSAMAIVWGPEFRFLYNDRYSEIIQDKHPAALGRRAEEIFPEAWQALQPLFERALAGEAVVIEDYQLSFTRNGTDALSYFSFSYNPIYSSDGQVDGFLAVVVETTARILEERAKAVIFDTTLSAISDFTYTFDLQGRFLYVNKALLDFWGIPLGEAVGKNFHDLNYPPELASRLQEQIHQVIEQETTIRDETPFVSVSGSEGYYEYIFAPVLADNGKVVSVAGSTRDITARKKLELEAVASANAKDDFLAALSHELRTPLTPVLMTAASLAQDPALPPDVREQLAMVERNVQLEVRLIDDLLDLTRISRGKFTVAPVVTDLHQLLGFTSEIVRSEEFGKRVQISFALDAEQHHAMVDPTRFQQVFWNLIKNALKFTPAGGSIAVQTVNDDEGWISISVRDSGIGITREALPHIFKAFEQGDIGGQHRYGGLGLGLAISQAIVVVHGGVLRAASEGAGLGATFTVSITTVNSSKEARLPAAGSASSARTLRLLVVEDHEATRVVLTRLLTRGRHSVKTAGTVHDALEIFLSESFDVVISDLGLPDGSGLDMMKQMQKIRPVQGIALSGYGMENDLINTKDAGFSAHLVKPVDIEQLRQLLNTMFHNESPG